jgi:hypothetical protein
MLPTSSRFAAAAAFASLVLIAPTTPAQAKNQSIKATIAPSTAPAPTATVRDHRAVVRDHRGEVRTPPRPRPICAGWAC